LVLFSFKLLNVLSFNLTIFLKNIKSIPNFLTTTFLDATHLRLLEQKSTSKKSEKIIHNLNNAKSKKNKPYKNISIAPKFLKFQ